MPLFEFECSHCGNVFEEIIAADAKNPACPKCGGESGRVICAPSPLKTGAFPYKPGPVHPMYKKGGMGCAGARAKS